MRTKVFSLNSLHVFLLMLGMLTPRFVGAQGMPMTGGQSAIPGQMATGAETVQLSIPQYAAFFSDKPGNVLWGRIDGLKLINIDEKQVIDQIIEKESISSLAVNPANPNSGYVATASGRFYHVHYSAGKANVELVPQMSSDPVGRIRFILYNPQDPAIVLAAEDTKIYRSEDGGKTWLVKSPAALTPELGKSIIMMMPDPFRPSNYLITTPEYGRLSGEWKSESLRSIPEKAIPHGYVAMRTGISYIPIGENSEYFSFKNMNLMPLHIVSHPESTNQYFIAGMGTSPVGLQIKDKRYEVDFMNRRCGISYTVSIDPTNHERIIISNDKGIDLSINRGADWKPIDFTYPPAPDKKK